MEAKPDFKAMSTQKKIGYVWDYYRFHIMGIIVLVITAFSIIHHFATLKFSVMDIIFLNAQSTEEDEEPFEDFLTSQGFDLKRQEVRVNTSLSFSLEESSLEQSFYLTQTLSTLFAVGELDIFASPHQIYDDFASSGYVTDLRTVFSEEELSVYEDLLIYSKLTESGENFPAAFNLNGNQWLKNYGYYPDGCYMGITINSDNPETAKEFILYLLEYQP